MMEPHASIAAWNGDQLNVWTSNQMINWTKGDLAKTLGIDKEKVRLMSPFIGGGFGGKLFLRADTLLAALGAREAKRPVKVTLQRPLMANNTTTALPPSSASASAPTRPARSWRSRMRAGPATWKTASRKPRSTRPACSMPARTG